VERGGFHFSVDFYRIEIAVYKMNDNWMLWVHFYVTFVYFSVELTTLLLHETCVVDQEYSRTLGGTMVVDKLKLRVCVYEKINQE